MVQHRMRRAQEFLSELLLTRDTRTRDTRTAPWILQLHVARCLSHHDYISFLSGLNFESFPRAVASSFPSSRLDRFCFNSSMGRS